YPAAAFNDAWKNVLLYSEHTWGADCSISQPESQKTREQWDIKQSYARAADQQSRALLDKALHSLNPSSELPVHGALELWNTTSWARTELVSLPAEMSSAG